MSRLSFRRIIRRPIALLPLVLNLALFIPQSASAELYITTGANDFYFTLDSQQVFTARAYAWQYGIDSMLWLYDDTGQQLAANDDYFGLDSYISITLGVGTYRLRTGVCCGDPNRWYGTSYQIDTSFAVVGGVEVTTTTSTTTTTEPPTTTTQEPTTTTTSSTTTTLPPTTETTVPDTTVPESTTTSTENLPTSTEPEPTTSTSELPQTSTTQPDVPATDATTTSLADAPTTTQVPETILPPETTTSSSTTSTTIKVPTATTSSVAPTITQPVVVAPTTTTTSEPAPRSEQVGSTTTVPPTTTLPPVLPELSSAEAVELALSSEVIQNVTPEQAAQIFESLDTGSLTNEQAAQLVTAVQGASEEVRREFENSVNIFDTKFETYVPVGSKVNVKTRKVIIAATGVLFVAPTISTSPPPAPTGGPSGGSGGSPSGSTSGESTGSSEKRQSRRGRK